MCKPHPHLSHPQLTVRETLEFSARVQSSGFKRGGHPLPTQTLALPSAGCPSMWPCGFTHSTGAQQNHMMSHCWPPTPPPAALMEELEEKEKELGVTPDPATEAYMKATSLGGARGRHSRGHCTGRCPEQ